MLNKKAAQYTYNRPFYPVDPNASIQAGMVAFMTTVNGVDVATVAASGTTPIGTFWKDHAPGYIRSTIETKTFNTSNYLELTKGNVLSTSDIKVTDTSGNEYDYGDDYVVSLVNGVVTRVGGSQGGAIPYQGTIVIWYKYTVSSTQIYWDNVSTKFSSGSNYDRQSDDTLGSGKITVVEGDAKLFTDQYDVTQTYTLNAPLRADSNSLWTTSTSGSSVCGRVIKVPTASDPFLGVQQVMVAQ